MEGKRRRVEADLVLASFRRMIVTPILLLPLIALCARYDLFEAAEDPTFILTAVLIISSPPAIVSSGSPLFFPSSSLFFLLPSPSTPKSS